MSEKEPRRPRTIPGAADAEESGHDGDAGRAPQQVPTSKPERLVSRRDERGPSYPGDFPNDLGDAYRGCF